MGVALLGVPIAHALSTSRADNRGIVAFVGDSNIAFNGGATVINLTFGVDLNDPNHWDDNYVPVFIASVGSGLRTPDCLPRGAPCATTDFWKLKLAHTFSAIHPGAIVTDLGINDSAAVGTASSLGYASYGQKIDGFMKLLPAGIPVFWTNLPCAIEPPSRLVGCKYINVALAQAALRWHNLVVLNWASIANSHPEYLPLTVDGLAGVHYSPAADAAWSKLVTNALDAHFPDPK